MKMTKVRLWVGVKFPASSLANAVLCRCYNLAVAKLALSASEGHCPALARSLADCCSGVNCNPDSESAAPSGEATERKTRAVIAGGTALQPAHDS